MTERTLTFVGGPHGVGKTTIIEALRTSDPTVATYDPGDLFWQYSIHEQIVAPAAVERMIAESLMGLACPVTLINWHYAVWTPGGYRPQISWILWGQVLRSSQLRGIVLALADAPTAVIRERREWDRTTGRKKRTTDPAHIEEEHVQSWRFFAEHERMARQAHPRVCSLVVQNTRDPETAAAEIRARILAITT